LLGHPNFRRKKHHFAPSLANNDCGRSATRSAICRKLDAPANTDTNDTANTKTNPNLFPRAFRSSFTFPNISNMPPTSKTISPAPTSDDDEQA
jgi:hypothetical protein